MKGQEPSERSTGSRSDAAARAQQPFVFEADIEATEAYSAQVRTVSGGLGVLFCLGLLAAGIATCGSGRAALAGLTVAAVGALVGVGVGWLAGGYTLGLIRSRSGLPAATATKQGLWRQTYGEQVGAKMRYYFGRPRAEDVPPGMTLEEYARARSKAKRLEWWSVLLLPVMFAWFLVALGVVLGTRGANEGGQIALALGAFAAPLVAGPLGWLARWRRERDAVARWAGALTMDEFMGAKGWQWHWFHGWRPSAAAR